MQLYPIGVIHSPYKTKEEAPKQGRFSDQIFTLEIFNQYVDGLKDISNATHLIVLYWLHLANREKLQTKTPFSEEIKGVFACRSPSRPNPIGVTMVKLISVSENKLRVQGLDALDGSPLLDLKPYSPAIDSLPEAKMLNHPHP
ncbi:tRNA (N6-threonylcarbamoyladenosine(37)-N6)-methyltransferase TrmO [Desulfofalx alkaliphila]|uniref:tRNA (N6-threonylcarbamoyladenosine(37)-N6)-methyltransferase TrmO n=1 Tax=Desulfofalx alkaliphila TaxID=105483 RepID=UPI0004E1D38A|nr:tRNA (N6-threonylcarbamoyladenosine(37)-N6)-methyltransferase TrmO [Desulfofalx alkaliphila]